MDTILHQRNVQHLFWRAGFGASPPEIQKALSKSRHQLVKDLFESSADIESLLPPGDVPYQDFKREKKAINENSGNLQGEVRGKLKEMAQMRRKSIGNLNDAWMAQMGVAKYAFREKMTLFWHNHFACRSRAISFIQQQNNTIRTHALGKFGDLLMAVSKDPAMLQFLNNQQNSKRSPNENFAREVMELFTIGRGNYTEQDVKEAARAFTGWGFNRAGEFVFRENLHDEGTKTIFGKSGNYRGEDVLDMLLSTRKTAYYLSTKLYRHFVNENVDREHVEAMAKRFYKSDYDIADLMKYVFSADWFYHSANVGALIKSPVDYIAGLQRTLHVDFIDKAPVLYTQKIWGQVLFNPPNVAGWPGGKAWIDSSSLLSRLQMPQILFRNTMNNVSVKESGDVKEEQIKNNKFEIMMDWQAVANSFESVSDTDLSKTLALYLLQVPISDEVIKCIEKRISTQERTEKVKQFCVLLMSTLEYQLC
ncbi:DUF1800 domain-containing protein [Runella slithyformis]|uniref:DUF1800 domain-containing protein n=1 Tax=Runella slithyformis (strain ATCC 29530 / DSM 19594 / LMG 11500 / NCIMB 11436 / LSU 4) TaxID=761193 RepID=A0A7U3ZJ83_RUNSL|nr:DUF1800 domain-containing protein [Runella slithyformis]AEI48130.1 protein of unknown function DUF1800 [Runella slithyformis DSM 19594]